MNLQRGSRLEGFYVREKSFLFQKRAILLVALKFFSTPAL
jgi:hypothetical protein